MSHVSDWPITAHRLRKETFRNTTRSICESGLSQVKSCASVYATESFLFNVTFEKTFRCVIGFTVNVRMCTECTKILSVRPVPYVKGPIMPGVRHQITVIML